VLRLAAARLAQLQAATARAPVFSWRQPDAMLAGREDVQAFLRGPEERATFTGFAGLPAARRWADDRFGYRSQHAAKACADGRGAQAFVQITKTRAAFEQQTKRHVEDVAELARVRAMLRAAQA
jgi:hypothetical protein